MLQVGYAGLLFEAHRRAMAVPVELDGYDAFCRFVESLKPRELENPHYFLFFGSKSDDSQSWCANCTTADTVTAVQWKDAPKYSRFIKVTVGPCETWKDSDCPFKNDDRVKLKVMPTLVRWKEPQKIEGAHFTEDLVRRMFQGYED